MPHSIHSLPRLVLLAAAAVYCSATNLSLAQNVATVPVITTLLLNDEPAQACTQSPVLYDFEFDTLPDEFFTFKAGPDTVSTRVVTVSDSNANARPGQVGDNRALSANVDVSLFGGFGFEQTSQDWSGAAGVSVWVFGDNSGADIELELQSGGSSANSVRASITLDFFGWQLVALPFELFFSSAGVFDNTDVTAWVAIFDSDQTNFLLDDFGLLAAPTILQDYEDQDMSNQPVVPENAVTLATGEGAFVLASPDVISDTQFDARPGQVGDNGTVVVTLDVPQSGQTGGFGHDYESFSVQDQLGIAFWTFGNNSGAQITVQLVTNGLDRATFSYSESFSGWRYVLIPLELFAQQSNFDPIDIASILFTVEEVSTTFRIDDLSLVPKQIACLDEQ